MKTSELYLLALLLTFTVPYLIWRLGRTESFAPLVVVQIVIGIVLGPGVLGARLPDVYRGLFQPQVLGALNGIAWWAVMLFVWLAGLELNLRDTWRHRRDTGLTAGLALGTPLLFGCIAALGLLRAGGWAGSAARPWQFVLGVGMACSVTALPILVLFLDQLGMLRQPLGQRVLRYASLDDVAIWGVLAIVLLDWRRITRQVLFLAAFSIASSGIRKLMRWLPPGTDRWYISLIWLTGTAFAADWAGLHFMVGAYLSGAVLDAEWFDRQRLVFFRDCVLLALMPVFFLSTGLKTSWALHGAGVCAAAAVLLLASVGGKLLGTRVAAAMLGWEKRDGPLVGWLLQTKALIMIIFAEILLEKRILTPETFTALLLMAVASTMLTNPMVKAKLKARAPSLAPEVMAASAGVALESAR